MNVARNTTEQAIDVPILQISEESDEVADWKFYESVAAHIRKQTFVVPIPQDNEETVEISALPPHERGERIMMQTINVPFLQERRKPPKLPLSKIMSFFLHTSSSLTCHSSR